jgi:hypothetical protein
MNCLVLFAVLMPMWWIALAVTDPRVKESRRKAEERGDELLRSWLTPEQERQWRSCRAFEVVGCHSGTRYRITNSATMNVQQLDATGRSVTRWCFMPRGDLVTGDVLLAQKIALETMESEALAVANASHCELLPLPRAIVRNVSGAAFGPLPQQEPLKRSHTAPSH